MSRNNDDPYGYQADVKKRAKKKGNDSCADCRASSKHAETLLLHIWILEWCDKLTCLVRLGSTWTSVTFGVFLCIRYGAYRSLGGDRLER